MFEKAEDKVNEAAGKAQEVFGRTTNSPGDTVKGMAQKYASQASNATRDATDTLRDQVISNPIGGLAIAGAVGIVIGYLLGRK